MDNRDWEGLNAEERRAFWSESERLLRELATLCARYLTDRQVAMARELIDHNEHQLVLEFLFDYLGDLQDEYPADIIEAFAILTARLGMTGNRSLDWLDSTSPRVAPKSSEEEHV